MVERRRRGVANRLRRLAYGVALTSSLPFAAIAAAGQPPAVAAAKASKTPAGPSVELDLGDRALLLNVLEANDDRTVLFGELLRKDLAATVPGMSAERHSPFDLTPRKVLLALRIDDDSLRSLRSGLCLDVALPELGSFHLTLYRGKNHHAAKTWDLFTTEGAADEPAQKKPWSVGGTLDLVRTPGDDHRRLVLMPQVSLELGRLLNAPGKLDASLQFSHWQDKGGRTTTEDPLPQVTLRWKF